MAVDATDKLVEGSANAGIYDSGSNFFVYFNNDKIGLFGRDINSARKVLSEKLGRA